MAPIPTHARAIRFGDFFAVLYTDKDGYVSWLNFVGKESAAGAPPYKPQKSIQADGKASIRAEDGKVDLVMYYTDNEKTICFRLYYIASAKGDVGKNTIRQLSTSASVADLKANKATFNWVTGDTDGAALKPAGFNAQNYTAADNSPIAAATDGPTIKVYFQKPSTNGALTVAYTEDNSYGATVSKETWKDRIAAAAGTF